MIDSVKKLELLAPVGDFERLVTAIHFGADAVYFGGKHFGLRAFAHNFDLEEIKQAVTYAHAHNVKVYITVNIIAHNPDFVGLLDYLKYLDEIKVDGVIVSDLGVANLVSNHTKLELHVSTQANITNSEAAKVWVKFGAKRLVLARELTISEIKDIKQAVGEDIEIECFCHGAMCISYSGRCLLSNYFTGRDSNKGACAQACRWSYTLHSNFDQKPVEGYFPIEEDGRGTYILNSKDMCLINHIEQLVEAGVTSFKIEGRMKTPYYVATTVNAYRRAINNYLTNKEPTFNYVEELEKTSHRLFTTGFYFNDEFKTNPNEAAPIQSHDFIAVVLEDSQDGYTYIEMRNKFKLNDVLEILSPSELFNNLFVVKEIVNEERQNLEMVNKAQQRVYIKTDKILLKKYDILRRKRSDHHDSQEQ